MDLNHRHKDFQSSALPTELLRLLKTTILGRGLETRTQTSGVKVHCAYQLHQSPTKPTQKFSQKKTPGFFFPGVSCYLILSFYFKALTFNFDNNNTPGWLKPNC